MTDKAKRMSRGVTLCALAIVFLVNPVVRVVDILPDFIACLILARYLTYPADRTPYFEEAKMAFVKLGFTSLAKIPAFFIISFARSVNTLDNDTGTLFTFVFSFIEAVLFYIAIKNLFLGIYYLGERSSVSSLLSPFEFSKKGRTMTPERLQLIAYVFAFIRCALTALPEMLLLSQTTDTGATVMRAARFYPYVIVASVIVTVVLAVSVAKRAIAYLKAVPGEDFINACDALISCERAGELEKRLTSKGVCFGLSVLTVASVLTVDLRFDNFNNVNLLPDFLYGATVILALWCLRRYIKAEKAAYISGGIFCAVSLVSFFVQIGFLDSYGYDALVKNEAAKAAYIPVIILSAAEALALAALTVFVCRALIEVAKRHTGITTYDGKMSGNVGKTKTNIYIYGVFAILCGVSKFTDILLRYYSDLTLVATDDGIGNVVSGLVPWFGIVVLIFSVLYIGYSLYLLSVMREDVEMRYS